MGNFLDIVTLFNDSGDRTIKDLSSYYSQNEHLENVIRELIQNRLSEDLIKGKRILLKPNWVAHSDKAYDDICLRTNDSVVLSALKAILDMRPSMVVIGDAPIQGCDWERMISKSFLGMVKFLEKEFNIAVQLKDFRRRTFNVRENDPKPEIKPLSKYVIFDLGKDSHLEPITFRGGTNFRVTDYDPDRMSKAHAPGLHKYCITKELFDADLIISLPKLKTHQKSGITGALKNLVGFNGDKDFLPHHRIGGTRRGGDCYPGGSLLRYISEILMDKANQRQGRLAYHVYQKLSSGLWKMSFPGPEHNMAAGWYGNDTTWRMVKDLNMIVEYGTESGILSNLPQRQIFSLCDGIVGGQGDGPLEPDPFPLGILSFTNNSYINDLVAAKMMDLPIEQIPLLQGSKGEIKFTINGENAGLSMLDKYVLKAHMPKGWLRI